MGVAIYIIMVIVMNFNLPNTESKSIPTCNGYICGDGSCINGTRCDGVAQCADGSDELRCERQLSSTSSSCSSSQFQCSTSSYSSYYSYYYPRCISSSRRCDGTSDCSDGSDERNCDSCYYCRRYYSYSTSRICSTRCDGRSECYDGSDEQNCGSSALSNCYYCRRYSYSSSSICAKRCDGSTECYDQSDEENCHTDDIGTIVGLSVGGLFIFICSPTIFITLVACVVYHNSTKSGQTTIITHPTTTTIRGGTDTGAGGASDQPGFQLQKLDYEKQAAQTDADPGVTTSESELI